ncbi:hypothetical protein HMPREF9135_2240 [Segatella baroniae F0067]|uniref:Uncharacterized protein n=1 Tax=Segatella baroniae F0067 TaxID=1115809 RepID=U2NJG2_9BACT|nr:hypothetical protein HMPREF9135_2240 [Segatella baroniae F0067]
MQQQPFYTLKRLLLFFKKAAFTLQKGCCCFSKGLLSLSKKAAVAFQKGCFHFSKGQLSRSV